jgi:hypothetical protein
MVFSVCLFESCSTPLLTIRPSTPRSLPTRLASARLNFDLNLNCPAEH